LAVNRICFNLVRVSIPGILAVLFAVAPALADSPATRPIVYQQIIRSDPPLHIYLATIDLSDPSVHVVVSRGGDDPHLAPPWEVTLTTVQKMAERDGLAIAINGSLFIGKDSYHILGHDVPYFEGNFARACGWAMSDGALFSQSPINPEYPSLMVDDHGQIHIGHFASPPPSARQMVSGNWQIVTDGKATSLTPGPGALAALSIPRTAAGVDREGKKLILLIADGHRPDYSVGVTMPQLADEMVAQGAYDAIELDSGGSSTMVLRGDDGELHVMNRPSDGSTVSGDLSFPRCVADALGVRLGAGATTP